MTYYLLDRVLASQKLALTDIKVVELPYSSMYPAFTTGAIDAVNLQRNVRKEPYAGAEFHDRLRQGRARVQ